MVERGDRDLGDALRSLLLRRDEPDWDLILPQTTRSLRAMLHGLTGETPNFLMFGRELDLPDTVMSGPTETGNTREQYAINLKERLETAYKVIIEIQRQTKIEDKYLERRFMTDDLVWLQTETYAKGTSRKLQACYYGPYRILEVYENNTYLLDKHGKTIRINEDRLKLYSPTTTQWGSAPTREEPIDSL